MPRSNVQEASVQIWTKFDENNPLHLPLIERFAETMKKYPGGFYEDYCKSRPKPFRNANGAYYGVREEVEGKFPSTRMPYKFLEEESMWQCLQRMGKAKVKKVADLPF